MERFTWRLYSKMDIMAKIALFMILAGLAVMGYCLFNMVFNGLLLLGIVLFLFGTHFALKSMDDK